MNKICYGCGVKLQTEFKDKPGYIPAAKLNTAQYCMRCFRMINYGEINNTDKPKDAKEIINKINKDVRFVIFLIDFLNINEEVMNLFKAIKKEKVLIINKCELIPRHINREKFKAFLSDYYKIKDPIKLKGGTTTHGATGVLKYLKENDIKEAYILGISNSGKSTLINDLLEISKSKIAKTTVNNHANTTRDFIRVKINDDLTLIDSPGFIINNCLNNDVSSKVITAYSMNMKECETVGILDNEYFLKFDAPTPITFYTNSKSKKAIKKYFRAAPNLVHTIKITEPNTDIIILGIGFVSIKKPVNITTNIDLKYIETRKSMFGGHDE